MATLLAELNTIEEAAKFELALPPGIYEYRLTVMKILSVEELNNLQADLTSKGYQLVSPISATERLPSEISIKYVKTEHFEGIGQWQIALIGIIPTAIIAALIGIGVFKIEDLTKNLMPIILISLGAIVAIAALLRKPAEKVAVAYLGSPLKYIK